jgi:CBS domain-containing protein
VKVKDIMTHEVEYVAPSASLRQAAERMRALDVGSLPVCENDRLLGVITDRDITIRAVADGQDPGRTSVRDVMSADPVACSENDDVTAAARLMESRQVRRLPVVAGNRLVGVVALADLATRVRDDRLSGEVLERVSEPAIAHP